MRTRGLIPLTRLLARQAARETLTAPRVERRSTTMKTKSENRSAGPERLLTIREFARIRRYSEKTVRRHIAAGKLPVTRTGRRLGIYPRHAYSDL